MLAYDHQEQVRAFHKATGLPHPDCPVLPDVKTQQLRANLIVEESNEFINALDVVRPADLVARINILTQIADALADLLYVTYGAAVTFGIDIQPVFQAVHEANMRKVGGPVREDGKRLKPPGWKGPEARIKELLLAQSDKPARVPPGDGIPWEGLYSVPRRTTG